MHIRGKRIILRAIEREDLAELHRWFNDPELVAGLGDVHFPSSRTQQERWFERVQDDAGTVRLAVQHGDGDLIGYSGFWDIHWRDRRAEHALLIGNARYSGQGYGREIIATCARYAFEEMALYRLDANVLQTNSASLKAYEASGFQVEGVLRAHAQRGGERVDRVMLGLLLSDYAAWLKESNYWND